MTEQNQAAFVLRIAPGGEDKVPEALSADHVIIGWAKAEGLLDPALAWENFREIVRTAYSGEPGLRKAGAAGGHLWRFIRDMKPRDLVVVPYGVTRTALPGPVRIVGRKGCSRQLAVALSGRVEICHNSCSFKSFQSMNNLTRERGSSLGCFRASRLQAIRARGGDSASPALQPPH